MWLVGLADVPGSTPRYTKAGPKSRALLYLEPLTIQDSNHHGRKFPFSQRRAARSGPARAPGPTYQRRREQGGFRPVGPRGPACRQESTAFDHGKASFFTSKLEQMFDFEPKNRQKAGKNMDYHQYCGYIDRLEDLGQQVLDLVAEMRSDPPGKWPRPGLGAVQIIGAACDVPTKTGVWGAENAPL